MEIVWDMIGRMASDRLWIYTALIGSLFGLALSTYFKSTRFELWLYAKFDLIIDFQTKFRNSLILKRIPHVNFYSRTLNGFFSSKKIKSNKNDHIENLSLFIEEDLIEVNFKINQLPKILINEAKRLLPNSNYVGFSITQGNEYRKKSIRCRRKFAK